MPQISKGALYSRIINRLKAPLLFTFLLLNIAVLRAVDSDTNSRPKTDYAKRIAVVHNLINNRIGQRKADSFALITHRLLDSIQMEIKGNDSAGLLKMALKNGINDSSLLIKIHSFSGSTAVLATGTIAVYCIDLATQTPLDSVKINAFSHDTLIATSFSTHNGMGTITDLKPGTYSLTFSKDGYSSFKDRWSKVNDGKVTSLEIPLSRSSGFFSLLFSIYGGIAVGAFLLLVFMLIYLFTLRKLGKRS